MNRSREPIDIDDPVFRPAVRALATSDAEPREGSEPAADVEPREAGSPGAAGEHRERAVRDAARRRAGVVRSRRHAEPGRAPARASIRSRHHRDPRHWPRREIRVGDVIGMLGGRTDASGARASDPTRSASMSGEPDTGRDAGVIGGFRESRAEDDPSRTATAGTQNFRVAEGARAVPTTTLFDCDLTRC